MLRKIIKSIVPKSLRMKALYIREEKQYKEWIETGKPIPVPHIVKQKVISSHQQKYGYDTLIETGTFMGDMIVAQDKNFNKIYSIELSVELYERAVKKFKNDNKVKILQGDSGKVLGKLMPSINTPAIFWLDGHYSSGVTAKGDLECPIIEELGHILKQNHAHVLLIDDARCFIGQNDYPTLAELEKYIKSKNSNYQIKVENDVICCTI